MLALISISRKWSFDIQIMVFRLWHHGVIVLILLILTLASHFLPIFKFLKNIELTLSINNHWFKSYILMAYVKWRLQNLDRLNFIQNSSLMQILRLITCILLQNFTHVRSMRIDWIFRWVDLNIWAYIFYIENTPIFLVDLNMCRKRVLTQHGAIILVAKLIQFSNIDDSFILLLLYFNLVISHFINWWLTQLWFIDGLRHRLRSTQD